MAPPERNRYVDFARALPFLLVGATLLSGCGSSDDPRQPRRQSQSSAASEAKPIVQYVSRTPGARIVQQPPHDPRFFFKSVDDKIALVDRITGDMILSQDADRERRIIYFAYVTKDRELVRIFMGQFGGGTYGRRWKVFPIRVWNIEDARHLTPAAKAALPRATLDRFAQFMSADPDFSHGNGKFMLIDAPVSAQDPLD